MSSNVGQKSLLWLAGLALSSQLYANISGTAYLELPANGSQANTYGVKDTNEPGVANITVTVTDSNGQSETTTTASDGSWSVSLSAPARVVFSNWPSYLESAPDGSSSATSVQFIDSDSSDVNFGLLDPNDYSSSAKPDYVTPLLVNGSGLGDGADIMSLMMNHYDDSGLNSDYQNYKGDQGTGNPPTVLLKQKDTGTTWGEAIQPSLKRIYLATVLKRHQGFANGNESRIYYLNYDGSNFHYFDLQGVNGIDLGSVTRNSGDLGDASSPNHDDDAYTKVGKISYGDLEYDSKTNKLWAVNLYQKGIIAIDTTGISGDTVDSTKVTQYKLSDLSGTPTCSGGELRPWALAIHNGKGYLGAVCDALTSQDTSDLKAYVLSFDLNNPSNGLTQVLEYGLDYDRSEGYEANFHPWSDDRQNDSMYNEPILTDIEFDENDNMYLIFLDRYGLQIGYKNSAYQAADGDTSEKPNSGEGAIRKVCLIGGQYKVEGTDNACPFNEFTATNEDDSSKTYDSKQDFFSDIAGDANQNPDGGAATLLKGSREILRIVNDPSPQDHVGQAYWNTNGDVRYSLDTGEKTNWYAHVYSGDIKLTGKSNGMGDVEFLTDPAPIELGNRVWDDTNGDGIQDAGEAGIDGVKVQLICGGTNVAEATTENGGYYIFSNDPNGQSTTSRIYSITQLQPGNPNSCKVIIPDTSTQQALSGKKATQEKQNGDDQIDSNGVMNGDNDEATIASTDIANPGANNHTYDFGFKKADTCLGDYVWIDKNVNGLQDSGEVGQANVTVKLLKDGADFNTTTTDANGKYQFCGLKAGKYQVVFDLTTIPTHYAVTTQDGGADDNDSDANPTTGETPEITVADGDPNNYTIDMGIYKKPCLGDYVWLDTNADGIQDSSESGIDGVTVKLLDSSGNELNSTTTATQGGNKGYYEFCDLDINTEYKVEFNPDTQYKISPKDQGGDDSKDSDADESTKIAPATVAIDDNMTIDAGIYEPACIGDYVWYDKNKDGIQDTNESGIDGVTVKLLDNSGNELNSTTTATNNSKKGYYEFCGLKPDSYKVKFIKPDGYEGFTTQNAGDGTNDSDADANGDIANAVTLKSGDFNHDIDAGLTKPPTSIDIEKYTQDRDSNFQDADNINDNDVPTLIEGHKVTWKYVITNTGGQDLTNVTMNDDPEGAPDKCVDESNATVTLPTSLASGDSITCYKEGVVQDASKGNYENNATVSGEDSDGNTATDEDPSHYKVVAPACIGNRIWLDTNANGIQDTDENNFNENITVTLLDANNNSVKDANGSDVEPIVTSNGQYEFCNLVPDDYKVKFTLPNGYYFSPQDKSGNANDEGANNTDDDSDVDPSSGETVVVHLDSGEKDLTWDAGLFKPACIGDYIWEDKNANGIQESGESGIAGVELNLVDGNGATVIDINGTTVATYTTLSDGKYEFCNLVPGEYQVKVTKLPDDYLITRENQGDNDTKDSDIDTFLATNGDMPKETLSSGEHNMTFDGGVFKPACLGDFVWKDKNANGVQDDDELGIEGVDVTINPLTDQYGNQNLKDVLGKDLGTINTDPNGKYEFCNLIPGKYSVSFKADPDSNGAPYITTAQDSGGDDTKDSDIPEFVESIGTTPEVILQSGENNTTLDAGYIQEICLGDYVWFDENLNGIQDNGELGVRDVKVTLTYADGSAVTNVYGESVKLTKTDSKGYYKYCHLYPAKDYKIHFDIPKSYHPTLKDKGSDLKDSDADSNGDITVINPVRDDYTLDVGIYCDCDDYLVHPENYHELKMSAINALGLIAMITALFVIVRRED